MKSRQKLVLFAVPTTVAACAVRENNNLVYTKVATANIRNYGGFNAGVSKLCQAGRNSVKI